MTTKTYVSDEAGKMVELKPNRDWTGLKKHKKTYLPDTMGMATDKPVKKACWCVINRDHSVKIAEYYTTNNRKIVMEYDPEAPCVSCGYAVESASMGGTAVCGWCDVGGPERRVEYERWKKELKGRLDKAFEDIKKNDKHRPNKNSFTD
jgi:hypothetical protein